MANKANIERKWYILDAAGKPLGKTATVAATLLRGKHKPEYTPHADCGDFVIVINAEKAVLTGKKLDQKYYRTHSGYVGGLKETKYRKLMQDKPELAMKLAVRGIVPFGTSSPRFPDPPEDFPRSRAHPRRTEARTVGRRIRRSETMYKSKKFTIDGAAAGVLSVAVHLFPNGTGAITIHTRGDIDDYFGSET